jgi:hypothetical protein
LGEELYGSVRTPIAKAGDIVTKLVALDQLRLRLDLFPYGIPVPDELLISFERAGRPR